MCSPSADSSSVKLAVVEVAGDLQLLALALDRAAQAAGVVGVGTEQQGGAVPGAFQVGLPGADQ